MSDDGPLFGDFWPPPERLPDPGPYQSTRCPLIVNQREADALREVLGEDAPDMLVSEPVPLAPITLDTLSMMLPAKPPPRRTMHCHPSVTVALKLIAPATPPSFMDLGRIGDLCGIDVYEKPDMMPGAWELREDDKVVDFGVLRSAT